MSTRKIMNAKDLSTDELIYFRSHAKATYMSDGTTTVEDAINAISNISVAYPIVNHDQSEVSATIVPNVFHIWGEMSDISISLRQPEDISVANEYVFQFTSGATATTLTLPNLQWASEPIINPNCTYQVSILNRCATIMEFEPLADDTEDATYLTIEVLEDDSTIGFSMNTIQYSTDLSTWSDLAVGSTVSANAGDKVYFKANLTPEEEGGIGSFYVNKNFNLSGNCNSMLFGDDAADNLDLTGYENAFCRLFNNSTTLQSVSRTFLPATTLEGDCYNSMFSGCTSLTTAPELPATTLAFDCYNGMFRDCTSLTTAPELPATTLANNCYTSMFSGCTALTTAPELPATTLADMCYMSMFSGCTSLTTAPELPATTLVTYCYQNMFNGCSKLNYIKMLATDISAFGCLMNWVSGVSSTGTFVKNPAATWNVTGASGIPTGWTVETASA